MHFDLQKFSDLPKIDYEKLYFELIYAVGTKWHDETRHETALRYIRQAEGYFDTQSECGKENIETNSSPSISENGALYWNVRDILFGPNR